MPRDPRAPYDGYYNCSAACWGVYTEVLEKEYSNAVLFGQVHQTTVDAYAVQHAGASHPDKSVCVHLVGLHLVVNEGVRPPYVPERLQRLVSQTRTWPHFAPPSCRGALTVFDVAIASDHGAAVREWSGQVWSAWSAHHAEIARLALVSR